ncbi:hypothetical protein [Clostridium rectalis]|uniref:hypothetical protein n=1 Tax=Clostridium rectalis TaxID=2040295 RepID=UPI000F63BBE2|nr:hypothetical protein [Clostridium rectalis]
MKNLKYYFDAVRFKLRKGTDDDPYVLKTGQYTIINGRTGLDEVPDITYKVRIKEYVEVPREKYDCRKVLAENEFYVDYSNGEITFSPNQNGKTVTIEYKGKGIIQYPAGRIYVHSPNPWAVDNLQELIDFIYQKEQELKESVAKAITFIEQKTNEFTIFVQQKTDEFVAYVNTFIEKAESKIREVDVHIELSRKQTNECKKITDETIKVKNETLIAKEKTEITTKNAINVTDKANQATQLSIEKTKECIDATDRAKEETENIKIDRLNTRLIWKEPVNSFAEIDIKHPNPDIGWLVMTMDNGNLYRWDNVSWKYIGNMKGGIPLVKKDMDGLMRKDDYVKLNQIEDKAQKNYVGEDAKNALPDYVHTKTMVFVLSTDKLKQGVQNVLITFPNEGVINTIEGICQTTGTEHTSIQLEKISELDFQHGIDTWTGVCEENKEIIFDYGEYQANVGNIVHLKVQANDVFRLNVKHVGFGIENITINVNILI